jgi:hypothetical protein
MVKRQGWRGERQRHSMSRRGISVKNNVKTKNQINTSNELKRFSDWVNVVEKASTVLSILESCPSLKFNNVVKIILDNKVTDRIISDIRKTLDLIKP